RPVDHQHAGMFGEQVGAPSESTFHMHALTRDRGGNLGGRGILGNIAGFEPRHHDLIDVRAFERRDLGLADARALLQREAVLADRVHRDRALGVARADGSELHRLPSGVSRSRDVISPMMATAISGGEIAPMGSPIGAWMRASCASEMPWLFKRSSRRACVFFEPSAPI